MKNITAQYRDLQEGKLSKANFMANARRDFPQWISPVNTFDDAIRILKSKRVLSEQAGSDDWFNTFQDELDRLDMTAAARKRVNDALDHVNPEKEYGEYSPKKAAEIFAMDIIADFRDQARDEQLESLGEEPKEVEENGSPNFRSPEDVATIVASKHADKLNPLKSNFKEFERAALQAAGEEMLAGGLPKATINNLLSGYGYFEDWVQDFIDALDSKLSTPKAGLEELSEAEKKEPTIDQVDYTQLRRGTEFEMSKMPVLSDENYVKAKQKAYKNLVKDPNAYRHLSVANYKEVEKKDKALETQEVKQDNHVDKANEQKTIVKNAKPNTKDNLGKQEKAKKGTPEGVKLMKESTTDQQLAEYEVGDESDRISSKEAMHYVANQIESEAEEGVKTYLKRDLDNAFDAMEDKFGQRFDDEVYQDVIRLLKSKGFSMVFKETQTKSAALKQLRENMLQEFTTVPEQKKTLSTGHQVKVPNGKVGRIKDLTQDNTATVEFPDGTTEDYQVNVLKHDVPGEVFRRNANMDLKKMSIEELKEKLVKSIKEAGEKTALVTTAGGSTTAIDYKKDSDLKGVIDNTDITSVVTGAGQKKK